MSAGTHKLEGGIGSSGAGVTHGCESSNKGAENLGPLQSNTYSQLLSHLSSFDFIFLNGIFLFIVSFILHLLNNI